MRVVITRDTHWLDKHLEPGAIVDVTDDEGAWLISRGRAEQVSGEAPKKEDRSVGLTTSTADGIVKRGRWAK